jgi:hypothetical protein
MDVLIGRLGVDPDMYMVEVFVLMRKHDAH